MAGKYLLGGAGGLVGYIIGNSYLDSATPLHVDVKFQPRAELFGVNILPAVAAVIKALPASISTSLLAKKAAPKSGSIADWLDHFGENPYTTQPVVPDKVWAVERKTENFFIFGPDVDAKPILGMDFTKEDACWRVMQGAEAFGREASHVALQDLDNSRALFDSIAQDGKTQQNIRAAGANENMMTVVKLNNGDVMLYSPVRVREEFGFAEWLDSIGPVKWIVLGSSAHTMEVASVLERYPDATCIAAKEAFDKLQHTPGIIKTKPDFDYTNKDDLTRLSNLLAEEGVRFHYIDGDCATQALVVIAHKTALEVDLIYSRCDGGLMATSKDELLSEKSNSFLRLFKWGLASSPTSPNDALPPYRFWMMDPTNVMSSFMLMKPKKDGSSCKDMANSLRTMLRDDFDQAYGVHCKLMDGDTFRKSIDFNWNWLDGESLLQPTKQ